MREFIFIFRIITGLFFVTLIFNALEIFALTRNWLVFLVPIVIFVVISILFKILKKVIQDNED